MILTGDYIPKSKSVRLELPFAGTILANLEGPVVGDAVLHPALKAGPNLSSRSLGTEQTNFIFNLANNHMMDYGEEGLKLTQQLLRQQSIPFVGAGDDLMTSRRPIVVEEAGKKIGIIGCCERQFGCSDVNQAGCAEKGLWMFNVVRELKTRCDFVIVSCHVAFEHSPLPSPRVREFYKLLIDAGADVIHGHHAHVPQGWEAYGKGVIFYGLGNFVVDPESWKDVNHRWSVIADLDFSGDMVRWKTDMVGVSQEMADIVVDPMSGEIRSYAQSYCECWNALFQNDADFLGGWQAVCAGLYEKLYGAFLKTPHYQGRSGLNFRSRLRYIYDASIVFISALLGRKLATARQIRDGRAMLNMFWCETHQDVIATALGVLQRCATDCRTDELCKYFTQFGIGDVE